jgi:hypothetical protein
MAIAYPVSLPDTTSFREARMTARTAVGVTKSPFTGAQQVQKHQGQWWEFECSLVPMVRDNSEDWIAFLLSLNGQEGTFLLGDPYGTAPRGAATTVNSTPLINGANQTGKTLLTDGWQVSTGNILKAGDYIQLGTGSSTRLHKVLTAATSNASGEATLDIFPEIKTAYDDNATITITDAKGTFRLASNEMAFDLKQASTYGMAFAAVGVV